MTDTTATGSDKATRGLEQSRFFSPPVNGLITLCVLQVLLWTIIPALVNKTPPTDTMEGYMWGREWILMSYKHPQMPAWLLEISRILTGSVTWGHYLLSQIMVVGVYVFVYLMGRDMMGSRAALAAVMLIPTLGHSSWGTRQFNHDVIIMPFWVAICWLLWRAQRDNSMANWVALGLVAGISAYAKFSMGLIILFGALWLFVEPTARKRMATPGPWVAMAIVLAFAASVLFALYRVDFQPMDYFSGRDGWVLEHRGRFYYDVVQILLLIFFPPALYFSGLLWRRGAKGDNLDGGSPVLLEDRRARNFLLWMGAGPAALLFIVSPIAGISEGWSKPMYSMFGLIAVAYLGRRLTDRALRRVIHWGLGVTLFMAATYAIFPPIKCYVTHNLHNACLPGQQIGARMQDIWHEETGKPLKIVAGGMSHVVGVFASDVPSDFTNFDYGQAPWITPERIREQGMLMVWKGHAAPTGNMAMWAADHPVRSLTFPWAKDQPPVEISYVVVPPAESANE